jgi:hypothetical protein
MAVFLLCLFEVALELLVIGLPEEHLPPFTTMRRYVVERPLVFDTQWSSHNYPTLRAASSQNVPIRGLTPSSL